MENKAPGYYRDVDKCVDQIINRVGKKIVLGLPLGLGKANHIANGFFKRAKEDPEIDLTIITALSLEKPTWSSELERRFLEPFVERIFGGYVELEYVKAMRKGNVPDNVKIKEFFTKAGSYLNLRHAQENYISSNYTHAWRDIMDNGVNVAAQIVCKDEIDGKLCYSTSCNPEVTLDVAKGMRELEKSGKKIAMIGQVNQNLPFMYGDAVVEPELFTDVLDNPDCYFRLFSAPKMAITNADFMIGLHAGTLVKDDGTLQIGIGSLGDAVCYGLQLRQEKNERYLDVLEAAGVMDKFSSEIKKIGSTEKFEKGLTGSTEMLVDGYLHLINSGVVKRKTYNNEHIQRLVNEGRIDDKITPEAFKVLVDRGAVNERLTQKNLDFLKEFGIFKPDVHLEGGSIIAGDEIIEADLADPANLEAVTKHCLGDKLKKDILIHGGFFLGPNNFYDDLKNMSREEREKIHMTSVLNVNQLYSSPPYASEELKILQRKNGRFINACLMVTLTGAVCSDALENGQIISGVGGQYNFVAQAHALPDARSILMCKSTRAKGKDVSSNLVWSYGHVTIPKHLRDFIVTEYGIADLRGKCDKDVIAALLNIADSRFQEDLLQEAKNAGKIPNDYQIPEKFKNNYPERLTDNLALFKKEGLFQPFPYGADFTNEELVIGKALRGLKEKMSEGLGSKATSIGKAMTILSIPDAAIPYLKRLDLENPATGKEKMMQKLVIYALSSQGSI